MALCEYTVWMQINLDVQYATFNISLTDNIECEYSYIFSS